MYGRFFLVIAVFVCPAFALGCGGSGSNTSPTSPSSSNSPKITVGAARTVTAFLVELSSSSVTVGTTVTATANATFSDGATEVVEPEWSSSDSSVASVSATGMVTTLTAGSVSISGSYEQQNAAANLTVTPVGPKTTFGAGRHRVGTDVTDIAAGRYYTNPSSGCYWERLSGFGGTFDEIIDNEFIGFNAGQWIVDILSSDKAFETDSDCGTWFNTPRHGSQANITQGMWLVGEQIQPGTYSADVKYGCYWARLRSFEGFDSIIENDFIGGDDVGTRQVTIKSTDVGFQTDEDCETWTRNSGLMVIPSTTPIQSRIEIEENLSRHRREGGVQGLR